MSDAPNLALAVLGDRRAVAWVLSEGKVAFPVPRYRNRFPQFKVGDTIYLYVTRGCFKNPTRDRAQVIGKATVLTDLRTSDDPVMFDDRVFPLEVEVRIESLAPVGEGLDVGALVPRMNSFAKPEKWGVYLRTSAFAVTPEDARMFDELLTPFEGKLSENLPAYEQRGRMGQAAS